MKRNILLTVFLTLSAFMYGGNSITLRRSFKDNGYTICYRLGNNNKELFALLGAFKGKELDMDVNDKFVIETPNTELVFLVTEDMLESSYEDGLRFPLTLQQVENMSKGVKTISFHKYSTGSRYSNKHKVSLHKLARILRCNYSYKKELWNYEMNKDRMPETRKTKGVYPSWRD